jgi:hypothetical protein
MTNTVFWVLLIVALAAAAGFAVGRVGHDEAVADADREQSRADLAVASLRRALVYVHRARRVRTEWPEWLPNTGARWTPPHARRRTAMRRLGIR